MFETTCFGGNGDKATLARITTRTLSTTTTTTTTTTTWKPLALASLSRESRNYEAKGERYVFITNNSGCHIHIRSLINSWMAMPWTKHPIRPRALSHVPPHVHAHARVGTRVPGVLVRARAPLVIALRVLGPIDPRMEDIAERKRKGEKKRERILSPNVNLAEVRPTFQFSSPYTPTYEIVR